jgi:glutathione S-transferase
MSKPTLIYFFAARGRAELIRLVLAEAGVDYQEHPVGRGTPPANGRPTDFQALRTTPLLPFGALPVWEEPDGFVLAQSAAIANHVARVHGLQGRTEREAAQCEQMLGAYEDVRAELRKLAGVAPEGRAPLREELASAFLPRWFGYFDRLLRANPTGSGFVVGASLTIADLALWYLIELCQDNGFGAAPARFPDLVAFAARVAQRPRLAEYVKSPRRHPFVPLPT